MKKRQFTKLDLYDARGHIQIPLRVVVPVLLKVLDLDFEYHYTENGGTDKLVIDKFQGLHYDSIQKEQRLAKQNVYNYILELAKQYGFIIDEEE